MQLNQKKAGVILSYFSQGIHILSGILYTPVMLRLLGQSEYGLYQLVWSVVSYLSLLSFGFSGSYMRFYSRSRAKHAENEIARLNGMFMMIFLFISMVSILCGWVMTANIHLIFSGGLTSREYDRARVLMGMMVCNLALTFPNSVFDAYTSAYERFLFQKALVVLQYLFHPFITLPLLLMGYGSVAMVAVTTGLTAARLVLSGWYACSRLKMKFDFTHFHLPLLKEMWGFTVFIFINMIVDQINWSVDKLLLGRFLGTVSVAVYGIGGQLNAMYLQFSSAVSNVFIPQVNRIVAESNDNRQLTALMIRVGRIQFMILALILSGFIFFGKAFIRIWAGAGYEEAYPTAVLLMVPVTIPLVQNIGIEIQRAKNMHRTRSVVYLAIAVGNVLVSSPLIRAWGICGAALGTAVTLLLGNGLFMNWYYQKRIGIDIRLFWKNIAALFPAMAPAIAAGVGIRLFVRIGRLPQLAAAAAVYTAVYCISMWHFGMNPTERKQLYNGRNK
ncbi:MAG: oligosaccharide flippase family protein [Lachnospiraceae bacterium]|nr:oligosaccharide flippase family protein [Lachnospiraceae bacterium]